MEQTRLPPSVSPDTFPAKLWWLVNNPLILSVSWDDRGQGLVIDEHLFVSEVLEAEPSFTPGVDSAWPVGSSELFKTRSFPSFIRQLNLYGFHKLSKGPVPGRRPGPCHGAGGSKGAKHSCFLHHFHSPYFLRDRPELLVHLKRLTKANKAKLLKIKDLPSHQHNQPKKLTSGVLQKGLLVPSSIYDKANSHGPLAEEQSSQPHCQDNSVAPSYTLIATLAHNTALAKTSNSGPFSPTSCQKVLTTVTYTVQPASSFLPLREWPKAVATSLTQDSSSAPSEQYAQASCPIDILQPQSPPAHTDLQSPPAHTDLQSPPTYTDLQSPPAHTDLQSPPAHTDLQSPPALTDLQSPPALTDLQSPPALTDLQSPPVLTDPLPDSTDLDPLTDPNYDFFKDITGVEFASVESLLVDPSLTLDDSILDQIVQDLTSSFESTSRKRQHEDEFPDVFLMEDEPLEKRLLLEEETKK